MNVCLRWALALGLLATAAMAGDSKSYRVTLPEGKIGNVAVDAGDYSLAVDGNKVQFKELKSGKAFDVAAKVETLTKKTDSAEVHSSKVDGVTKISEIRPGGSKIRLDFREQTTP
jgi:hypothetical protein